MTREEAISIMNVIVHMLEPQYDTDRIEDAVEMAIQALEQEPTTKNDLPKYCDRNICLKNEYNNVGCEDCEVTKSQEPTTKNETLVSLGAYKQVAWERDIAIQQLHELGYEFGQKIDPTTKNNLGFDCISRADAIKAMDTWDKFGNDPNKGLIPIRTPALQDRYIPYVKYDDMVNCVKSMPSVTPQEPKTGHWIKYGKLYQCSECKELSCCQGKFCNECGTKMSEPHESEDK